MKIHLEAKHFNNDRHAIACDGISIASTTVEHTTSPDDVTCGRCRFAIKRIAANRSMWQLVKEA